MALRPVVCNICSADVDRIWNAVEAGISGLEISDILINQIRPDPVANFIIQIFRYMKQETVC